MRNVHGAISNPIEHTPCNLTLEYSSDLFYELVMSLIPRWIPQIDGHERDGHNDRRNTDIDIKMAHCPCNT